MDQLNEEYPPPQARGPPHPLPATHPHSPPEDGQHAGPSSQFYPIVSSPRKQPASEDSSKTPSSLSTAKLDVRFYSALAVQQTHLITKDWVPYQMTPAEMQKYLEETRTRLANVKELERAQQQLAPDTDPRIEQSLFMARLDHNIRFCRIFRINDLPTEILINIFRYVIWSADTPATGISWRLWLTAACRRWRVIAILDSTLWSAIWFSDLPYFTRSFAWLERAKNSPIDIRINDTKALPMELNDASLLGSRLFPKISRIRTMIVVIHDWDPLMAILSSLYTASQQHPPMAIERLEFHRAGDAYQTQGTAYAPAVYNRSIPLLGGVPAPSLKQFITNGIHMSWPTSLPVLNDLTVFDLRRLPLERCPTLHEFRHVLQHSPSLERLILDGAGPKWPPSTPLPKPIVLSSVRTLGLGNFNNMYGSYVLSLFESPNVRELILTSLKDEDYTMFYLHLARKNMAHVIRLSLNQVDAHNTLQFDYTIAMWLNSMPRLAGLSLSNMKRPFLDRFLQNANNGRAPAEHQAAAGRVLCPNLICLEFQPTVDAGMVADWLEERTKLNAVVRKVYLTLLTARSLSQENHHRLKNALRGQGVIQILAPQQRIMEEDVLQESSRR